jgi:hypothetical protein
MSKSVKTVHLAIGVDLLGSRTSLQSGPNTELTELPHGIEAFSKATGRRVVIPFSNIRGYEYTPEAKAKSK